MGACHTECVCTSLFSTKPFPTPLPVPVTPLPAAEEATPALPCSVSEVPSSQYLPLPSRGRLAPGGASLRLLPDGGANLGRPRGGAGGWPGPSRGCPSPSRCWPCRSVPFRAISAGCAAAPPARWAPSSSAVPAPTGTGGAGSGSPSGCGRSATDPPTTRARSPAAPSCCPASISSR